MESTHTIALHWIFNNSGKIPGKLTQFHWPQKYDLDLFDFQYALNIDGQKHTGRGTDRNKSLALTKAYSEAIERLACFNNKISSNGVSSHVCSTDAESGAFQELLERDCFITHFLTRTSLVNNLISSPTFFSSYINSRRLEDIDIKQYDISCYHQLSTVITIATHKRQKFGLIIGLGTNKDIHLAQFQSMVEVIRNTETFLDGGFSNSKTASIHDDAVLFHIYYALNSHNLAEFQPYLEKSDFKPHKTSIPLYKCQNIEINSLEFKDSPFIIKQAHSNEIQNMFWMQPSLDIINMKRLSHFLNMDVQASSLNLGIHPLG